MNKRIWELDALRGLFMILIIFFHLMYDLVYLFELVELTSPLSQKLYALGNDWGGTPFLLLSGLCATLGANPARRAGQVFCGALAINLVTGAMYLFGFAGKGIIIYFGVLHCIGACMLLWLLARKLPSWGLVLLGIVFSGVGLYLKNHVYVDFPWLIPLGLIPRAFTSSDFFPLLPNFGYFLLGAAAGRWLYPHKQSLLPKVDPQMLPIRFFRFFGKHSLIIYLLHQPLLAGLVSLWVLLT